MTLVHCLSEWRLQLGACFSYIAHPLHTITLLHYKLVNSFELKLVEIDPYMYMYWTMQ